MKTWRLEAGRIVPCTGVPLEDRGFRYGMSFFETVAVFRGRAIFLSEHLERLARVSGKERIEETRSALEAFTSHMTDGVVRIYRTAGAGRFGDPFSGETYVLSEAMPVNDRHAPARVMSSAAPYFPRPGGAKTANYWQNVDAWNAAQAQGCEEALLFNPTGTLVSASMANVFLRLRGEWVTPGLESGARDGVVRAWAIRQFSVREMTVHFEDLALCDACVLTNSRIGVRAVGELDGRPLAPEESWGEIYRESVLGD